VRKICFISSSRADYGLLKNVMRRVSEAEDLDLQIAITGGHLDHRYGHTVDIIEKDGFTIDARIPLMMDDDGPLGVAATMASAMKGFGEALAQLQPDLLFVLGDRHEILAAVLAAHVAGIPVAHHSGGDVTTGAYDDALRHCITKCAAFHFVSCEASRRRVLQMGEHPDHVFLVGGLGIENIVGTTLLSKETLEDDLPFCFDGKSLLVTFHPETNTDLSPLDQVTNLIDALRQMPDLGLIFTSPNHDKGSFEITKTIEDFVSKRENSILVTSLGELRYISVANIVDGVVGNSSSGICEIPSLQKPVLNIGNRQEGRERASCIIDVNNDQMSIHRGLEKLFSAEFRALSRTTSNPYDHGVASLNIIKILMKMTKKQIGLKKFVDLSFPQLNQQSL